MQQTISDICEDILTELISDFSDEVGFVDNKLLTASKLERELNNLVSILKAGKGQKVQCLQRIGKEHSTRMSSLFTFLGLLKNKQITVQDDKEGDVLHMIIDEIAILIIWLWAIYDMIYSEPLEIKWYVEDELIKKGSIPENIICGSLEIPHRHRSLFPRGVFDSSESPVALKTMFLLKEDEEFQNVARNLANLTTFRNLLAHPSTMEAMNNLPTEGLTSTHVKQMLAQLIECNIALVKLICFLQKVNNLDSIIKHWRDERR